MQRSQLKIGTGSAVEKEARVIVRSVGFLAPPIEQAVGYVRTELTKVIFKFRSIYAVQRPEFLALKTSRNT